MADNLTADPGSGGATLATDDIAGVHYPRSKVVWGPDGTANDTDDASGKRLPVKVAESVAITANAGSNLNTSALALEGGNLASLVTLTAIIDSVLDAIAADSAAASASLAILDDWDESDRAKVNPIVGQAGVQGGSGAVSATTQRVVLATDVALPAGTNNIGDVDILTLPGVAGTVAHDDPDSGNPVKIGGVARTSDPTAAANADRVNFIADLSGKQIVLPYALPENFLSGVTAAITGTGDTSVIAAQGSGIRIYVTHLLVTNSHATVGTVVEIKDNTTVIYRGYAAPAGGGFSATLPAPLRLTANTALQAANVTTGSSTYVSASGYKAP